jgi:hypothetical protein
MTAPVRHCIHGRSARQQCAACNVILNEQRRERERPLRMEEALHQIAQWADAYPLKVFPEPDEAYYAKANEVLKANGMTLDRLSAAAMRHVIKQVGEIAKGALK